MVGVSVVVPVYRGEATLADLVQRLAHLDSGGDTGLDDTLRVTEVLLVWDGGSADSRRVIEALAREVALVRPIWLSRNFGQHAATLAGISSSTGDWVVTMDEDGQHDPVYIKDLLSCAYKNAAQLVYAQPSNEPPHGWWRNAASRTAKSLLSAVTPGVDFRSFNSFRLIDGEVARSSAAYAGPGVYLDIALSWVVSQTATCPVPMQPEGREKSGYSFFSLLSHFGRMVVSAGTRPLAFVSLVGVLFFFLGVTAAGVIVARVLSGVEIATQGWASTFTALLVIGGLILFSLGVIAQYMRVTIDMSLGKPLYLTVRSPDLPKSE